MLRGQGSDVLTSASGKLFETFGWKRAGGGHLVTQPPVESYHPYRLLSSAASRRCMNDTDYAELKESSDPT